ncbi:Polynucleotidyl transferase, ribonuclease H fold [Penicillium camemberti]|uniref:Polynucleotidyl transferase, ribonuclease H fold n=1 Tax=Penicillium camemberti (strain FM 013) TaxID=1429867 RepID=A0A0G4PNY5_PENC3|nr:Polynucleotidyl transferase, ribonuclease H fold [Penicillium camemberti]
MRGSALKRGRARSESCPPALDTDNGHGSPVSTEGSPLAPLGPGLTTESPSSLEELEEGEIPSTPPTTNFAPPPPNTPPENPQDSTASRGANQSPGPSLGQPAGATNTPRPESPIQAPTDQVAAEGNATPSHKRKRSSSVESDVDSPPGVTNTPRPESPTAAPTDQVAAEGNANPSHKRKRSSSVESDVDSPPAKQNNATKPVKKFCYELGHEFAGFVCKDERADALDFAKNILEYPVPDTVSKRLVFFSDASHRSLCGAVGIVWPTSLTSSDWEGRGVHYPISTDDTSILELFAISCSLQLAIQDIDSERATVAATLPRTSSQPHAMSKEVFLFSDDEYALSRIGGDLAYATKGDIASQLAAISRQSKTLRGLGVHIELHLSPGHLNVPGNHAADAMAKKAMYGLYAQTKTSWPTAKSVTSITTQPAPLEFNRVPRVPRALRVRRRKVKVRLAPAILS